jgi:hypothetical protein
VIYVGFIIHGLCGKVKALTNLLVIGIILAIDISLRGGGNVFIYIWHGCQLVKEECL